MLHLNSVSHEGQRIIIFLTVPQFPLIMFNMHMLSLFNAQGIMTLLISPTFYGTDSCTIFQERVTNNPFWTSVNELHCVARRG